MTEEMDGMREHYERALGDVKNLTRDTRDKNKYMESINIRGRETSPNLEGSRLDLLEAQ